MGFIVVLMGDLCAYRYYYFPQVLLNSFWMATGDNSPSDWQSFFCIYFFIFVQKCDYLAFCKWLSFHLMKHYSVLLDYIHVQSRVSRLLFSLTKCPFVMYFEIHSLHAWLEMTDLNAELELWIHRGCSPWLLTSVIHSCRGFENKTEKNKVSLFPVPSLDHSRLERLMEGKMSSEGTETEKKGGEYPFGICTNVQKLFSHRKQRSSRKQGLYFWAAPCSDESFSLEESTVRSVCSTLQKSQAAKEHDI